MNNLRPFVADDTQGGRMALATFTLLVVHLARPSVEERASVATRNME